MTKVTKDPKAAEPTKEPEKDKNTDALFLPLTEAPHYRALGIQLRHSGHGVASARMTVQESLWSLLDVVDQGVLMTLGGFACHAAVLTLVGPGRSLAPLEQRLSIIATAKTRSLIAKARVESQRSRLANCHFRIIDEEGELIATGGCITYILPREQHRLDAEHPSNPQHLNFDDETNVDEDLNVMEGLPTTEFEPSPFHSDLEFEETTAGYGEKK